MKFKMIGVRKYAVCSARWLLHCFGFRFHCGSDLKILTVAETPSAPKLARPNLMCLPSLDWPSRLLLPAASALSYHLFADCRVFLNVYSSFRISRGSIGQRVCCLTIIFYEIEYAASSHMQGFFMKQKSGKIYQTKCATRFFDRIMIDWCCFHDFIKNSLVALLEAVITRILSEMRSR